MVAIASTLTEQTQGGSGFSLKDAWNSIKSWFKGDLTNNFEAAHDNKALPGINILASQTLGGVTPEEAAILTAATKPEAIPTVNLMETPKYDAVEPSDEWNSQALAIQTKLKALGYELDPEGKFKNGGVDGYYGDVTAAAVRQFQHDNKLEVTGIATAKTLEEMQTQFAALEKESPVLAHKDSSQNLDGSTIRSNIITEAGKHIGITEIGGNNRGEQIFDYLNDDFGGQGASWCAGFVSHVLDQASPNTMDYDLSAKGIMNQAKASGSFHDADSGYLPQEGDIVVFERGATGDWKGHVGIVASVADDGSITTIEGNVRVASGVDGVKTRTYSPEQLAKSRLIGYGNTVEMHASRNEAIQDARPTMYAGAGTADHQQNVAALSPATFSPAVS